MPTPSSLELTTINPNPKPKLHPKNGKPFGRGNPPPNPGREKGNVNRITRDLKHGVITAAVELGEGDHGVRAAARAPGPLGSVLIPSPMSKFDILFAPARFEGGTGETGGTARELR